MPEKEKNMIHLTEQLKMTHFIFLQLLTDFTKSEKLDIHEVLLFGACYFIRLDK